MSYLKAKYLSELMLSKQFTIALAESCTGGSLSSSLTSIAGASSYFNCGFITYSNESKVSMLGVDPKTIELFGAVSEKVAFEMAFGAGIKSNSNLSIAVTGIAGPSGGTKEKPVGTVYIGIKYNKKTIINKNLYSGSRKLIQNKTIKDIFKIIDNLI